MLSSRVTSCVYLGFGFVDVSCASISFNEKKIMKKCLCLLFLLHMERIFFFYKIFFIKRMC